MCVSCVVRASCVVCVVCVLSLVAECRVFHTQMSGRVVDTQYGKLRGVLVSLPNAHLPQVEAYLGLQYASVLDGDLRFMPPTSPLEKWNGVRVALKHRAVCPQLIPDVEGLQGPRAYVEHVTRLRPFLQEQSEECLTLNVYVPVRGQNDTEGLPVLVFVHGESYEWGSGNAYDGSVLAAYGRIVVVTLNYRLGPLGFLSTGDSNAPGNYGLLDVVAALHWLRENIGAFGGDPDDVTLMGQGHGAAMVHLLLVSPVTKGRDLFSKVILQSGSALSRWALTDRPLHYTRLLATTVNCSHHDTAQLVACLKDAPYEKLCSAGEVRAPRYLSAWAPVIDQRSVLPAPVLDLMDSALNATRLLVGVVEDEGARYLTQTELDAGLDEGRVVRAARTLVRSLYQYHRQPLTDVILHTYTDWSRPRDPAASRDSLVGLLGDSQVTAPVMHLVDVYTAASGSPYVYAFSPPPRPDAAPATGGCGQDMMYVFGAPLTDGVDPFPSSFTREEKTLSATVLAYWTNFVHTGNPNLCGEVCDGRRARATDTHWPAYDDRQRRLLHLGPTVSSTDHYRARHMALWLDLVPALHASDDLDPSYHRLDNHDNASTFEEGETAAGWLGEWMTPGPRLTSTASSPPSTTTSTTTTMSPSPTTSNTTTRPNTTTPLLTTTTTTTRRGARTTTPRRYWYITSSVQRPTARAARTPAPAPTATTTGDSKLSLSVTIAVGCSLLFLNILVFAGVYYQKDRMRQDLETSKRELELGKETEEGCEEVVASNEDTDTNSSSMRTPSMSPAYHTAPPRSNHSAVHYKDTWTSGRGNTCPQHAHMDRYYASFDRSCSVDSGTELNNHHSNSSTVV